MANRLVSKKGLWLGGLAIAALLVATAIPGLAAPSQRTIAFAITSPTTAVAANTSVVFHAKVTNNSPVGSVSNPSSLRVTLPLGFTVTAAALATQASGESTNTNPSAVIIPTAGTASTNGTVTVNSINPLQRLEFVTVLITATTPNIGTCNGPATQSGPWSAGASTGSTYGQGGGQPFTMTSTPPTTSLTKSCSTPTISIVATTPTTYTVVGGTMTFSATVTGDPSPTVTWQSSTDQNTWTDITAACSTGGTPTTCSFNTAITDDGKYYRATANNGVPDPTSNVYSNAIQIAYAPPCGTPVTETGGGTTATVILVKNPVNTDDNPATCDPKPFALVVGQKSIQVLPTGSTCSLALNTCATYVVYSNDWAPEPAVPTVPATTVSPTGNPPSTTGTEAEVWCDGLYDETDAPSPANPDGTYGTSMPDGHQWCKVLQTTAPAGTGFMQVSEISLLIGDASRNR